MRKRILAYRKGIDKLLQNSGELINWSDILSEHLQQTAFFQHERLIHLIVTMTVALLTLICLGFAILSRMMSMLIMTGVLAILLIPYILHYYLLENEVQKMYVQYDHILEMVKKQRTNPHKDCA